MVRLAFFLALSIAVLVVDVRYRALDRLRTAVSVVLHPLQLVANLPVQLWFGTSEYFVSVATLQRDNAQLRRQHLIDKQILHQSRTLQGENNQLRKLMGAAEVNPVKSVLALIQFDARDPFARKIIVDKGTLAGVQAGQPVIDDQGVIGQVTRSYPLQSEVTLVTDKYQTVPVQVERNGLRSVAYGGLAGGLLELRFMAANADVQENDLLVTSGIDGIYPSGLPVAKVLKVERNSSYAFAKIFCVPLAGVDRFRYVLILGVDALLPAAVLPENDDKPKSRAGRKTAVKN